MVQKAKGVKEGDQGKQTCPSKLEKHIAAFPLKKLAGIKNGLAITT